MQNTNVPIGWHLRKLSEICDVRDGTHSSPKFVDNGFPLITSKNLIDGKIDFDNVQYITQKDYVDINKRSNVEDGDILLAMIGTIGKPVLVKKDRDFSIKNVALFKIGKTNSALNNVYLYNYLNNCVNDLIRKSSGGTQKFVGLSQFRNFEILVPPFAEQKKIAEILGTWDRAIEELTGLIAEKKELKRGLMQRLLAGTQRLPGFTKTWKKIKLSDVLEECVETTTTNNQYEILTSSRRGIFRQEDYFDKQVASQDNIGYKIIRNGDFTYRAMTDDDKFCFNQLTDFEIGIVSPAYAVFRTKKIPGNILKFILNSERFGYELLKEAQGGTRKSLKYNSLIKLQIYVPDDEEEMARLSECLHIADSEIDLLNQQLDVLREQKRGLMQKLLTGEIRVKVDNE